MQRPLKHPRFGEFLSNIGQWLKIEPDFVAKRKAQLDIHIDNFVCKDCLLGTHMYCGKKDCHCCHGRTDFIGKNDTEQA